MRELLIKCREERNLTQEDLADELSTTQQNISFIENGKRNPNIVLAKKLELFFHKPMESLFPDIFLNIETTKCNLETDLS